MMPETGLFLFLFAVYEAVGEAIGKDDFHHASIFDRNVIQYKVHKFFQ